MLLFVIESALLCLNDVRNDLVERGIGKSYNISSEGTEYMRGLRVYDWDYPSFLPSEWQSQDIRSPLSEGML